MQRHLITVELDLCNNAMMKYNNLRCVRDTSGGENNGVEWPRASVAGYGDRQGKTKWGRRESYATKEYESANGIRKRAMK
ncbi:hypothetical protein Peur_016275 [Populus x canadensis]